MLKALYGGFLIGGGAAMLLLVNGRIAGISGIAGNLVRGSAGDGAWRVAFVVGLVAPALLLGLGNVGFAGGLAWTAASGLLVGFGTQVGSGCTSGHGVCGLANLSVRSLVATLTFMATAMITVFIVRHGTTRMKTLAAFVAGVLFGAGLLISGMTNPTVVLGFLDVSGDWNPALAFTMAGAIAVAVPAFHLMRRRHRTLLGEEASLPGKTQIDAPLVVGSVIFGLGWGLGGICPGPGLVLLTGGSSHALTFVAAMAGGMLASRSPVAGIEARMRRPTGCYPGSRKPTCSPGIASGRTLTRAHEADLGGRNQWLNCSAGSRSRTSVAGNEG